MLNFYSKEVNMQTTTSTTLKRTRKAQRLETESMLILTKATNSKSPSCATYLSDKAPAVKISLLNTNLAMKHMKHCISRMNQRLVLFFDPVCPMIEFLLSDTEEL